VNDEGELLIEHGVRDAAISGPEIVLPDPI
jgi:hypothetical protein